jgi:ABC-type antimicrobial peptide transport system permease subunit
MSYGAIALGLGLLAGLAVALLAAAAVLAHRRGRQRLLAGLTPAERLAFPRDLFWRNVVIGVAVAVAVVLALWLAAALLPEGGCVGDEETGDCSAVHRTL